jgi:hypothetical protein
VSSATDETETDDEMIVFAGGGQYSEIPRRLWIETELARRAAREVLRHREAP